MKRSIARAAGSLILAAGLLAGCGSVAGESPYASAANRAFQRGYPAAAAATRSGSSAPASPLAWWRRPMDLVRQAGAAEDAAKFAADRLREMGSKLGGPAQPASR